MRLTLIHEIDAGLIESAAEQLNDVEALWMLSDETMLQSSGWGK